MRKVEREAISAAPWQAARDAAREWGQTIVLKGGYTIVATPTGELWVAPLANPALAAAGTGDTLAGLIASLLAKGLSPDDAAILGVWATPAHIKHSLLPTHRCTPLPPRALTPA